MHDLHFLQLFVTLLTKAFEANNYIGSRSLSWKYSTGQKNGVHAFDYNSAEYEPIWIKSGALSAVLSTLLAAGPGRFWVAVWEAAEMLLSLVRQITHNFTRFPVGQILRQFWTRQRRSVRRWKRLEQNFVNFTIKGRFFQKTQIFVTKFPDHATSGRHNSATITNRWIFATKVTLYGMSSYPHILIDKVFIYRLLFAILFVCLYVYGFLHRG